MKRNEVNERYKWKIEDIFVSDEEWEKSFADLEKRLDFSKYAGKLGDRETLLKFFRQNDEFCIAFEKLILYAQMKHDEDTSI